MAWTAFPTWVVGQVSLASDWNTYVAANMQTLATPPICRVVRNSAYTYTAAAWTVVPYDTVQMDTTSGFASATQLYTASVAGQYIVNGRLSVGSSARLIISVYVNGGEYARGNDITANSTATDNGSVVSDLVINVVPGMTIGCYYYCGFPQAADIGANVQYMSIVKVSN